MGKVIAVIDGQGGGLGGRIVERLKACLPQNTEIVALGTNAIATSLMMKAGASRGASGENAIAHTVMSASVILGSISIVMPNAMLGELTSKMAEAISRSPATKFLLPVNNEGVHIMGVGKDPLSGLIDKLCNEAARSIGCGGHEGRAYVHNN